MVNHNLPVLAGAEALVLVSWWKPLILLVVLCGWAWVVSTIYDKDAQRFYFKRKEWNLAHMGFGLAGLACGLLIPVFWIGLPAMAAVLFADLAVYFMLRNKDDRVPPEARWSLSLSTMMESGKEEKDRKKRAATVSLTFKGHKGVVEAPDQESPEYAIRAAAEGVLIAALEARGSRVDLGPAGEGRYGFAYMVDGVRVAGEPMRTPEGVAIIDFFKRISGMDLEDRRRKQVADITMERLNVKFKLRLTTMGAAAGPTLTILFNPDQQVARKIDELGMLPSQVEEMKKLAQEGEGVVLIAAMPHQGRTSTLYATVRLHDAYTSNVQTLEVDPQGSIDGVRHNVFDAKVDGAEFATTARSLLRRDPDVLAIAELPDPATAQEVTRVDSARTRVYLSFRAENALQAVQLYVKAAGDAAKAAKGLRGAVASKLLRKLCPNCKQAYQPPPDLLKKLGLPSDKPLQMYRKGGQVLIKNKPEVCPMCGGGGYFGQEGCYEVFTFSSDDRAAIEKADFATLKASLRKRRLPSIQEAAMRKAIDGVTSLEEVVRITSSPSAPAQQARKPATPPQPAG